MKIDDKIASELFRQYGKRLYNTALRITLSSYEAEEIMQETLIRFLTGGDRPDDVWAWLRRMCINKSIDYLRREKRFVNIDDAVTSSETVLVNDNEDIWSGLDGKLFPMVMELLKSMPDGYRTILTLKLIEDIDYKEIASMLGISESSVLSQYMRGRRKLAEKLKEKSMIMNDIEKYFDNYRCLADVAGDNPSVTEQDFLGRLHKEQARKRFRAHTLALTFIGIAAALAVFVILSETEVPVNPVEVYMTSYREGVAPLLSEVREMEMSSELCREMDLSSVIEDLLDSSDGMTAGLDGLEDAEKLEITRKYCDRSLDEIRTLYGECCRAYCAGTIVMEDKGI